MEEVHETHLFPWVSDLISVREFRNAAYVSCSLRFDIKEELRCSVDERMMRYFGDQAMLDKQEESCSPRLLDSEGDAGLYKEFSSEFTPPENNKLWTLKFQAQDMAFRNKEDIKHRYRKRVRKSRRYRYCSDSMLIIPRKRDPEPSKLKRIPVEHPEVVLTVQIFRPQDSQPCDLYDVYDIDRTSLRVQQQFQVLGCQYLTEVRDAICCRSDSTVVGELSEDPYSSTNKTFQEIYKSGFFYINGVFYNDMRDPQNKDYSRPIREWSKTAHGVGPFSVSKMEETKFIDLEIQLGLPYVYQHQGNCEHLLVFSDIRLMSSRDRQDVLDYPLSQQLNLIYKVRCMVCLLFTAKWVTTEDSRLCELPFFFCDKCFMAFNYDVEGNKIADFKAHKYIDRSILLNW